MNPPDSADNFTLIDATIADIHAAYAAGTLTCRALVEAYLDRIEKIDRAGAKINSIISLNPRALEQADALDASYTKSGPVGPLHGIPVAMKDQGDVREMPTTMGSVLFDGHMPERDSFVAAKLRDAGAIFIAKTTLGEMGAGDTHGSLFGSTACVYDTSRTAGGSSGGSGAAVSANLVTVAVGQEGFASIRRPAIWNGIVGMRPTAGLVSRGGVYAGWPSTNGSLGPMTRTVTDAARMLDVMHGFDADDPITGRGVGKAPVSYVSELGDGGMAGKRIGILRTVMGYHSEPDSDDFYAVDALFDNAVADLSKAGAVVVDPVEIPGMIDLLAQRSADGAAEEESFKIYMAGSANPPFDTMDDARKNPNFSDTYRGVQTRWAVDKSQEKFAVYTVAREELMTRFLKVMAENKLDAIVHKAVEHTPTLIADGTASPWTDQKGAPHLNTFLIYVPSVVVPAGFTDGGLPVGITFLGRPYSDAEMLSLAYGYEQVTGHRRVPELG
ncbi:MAG: Glutamyl-tRNA(Gln) amidotransferase subunit A [Alphaproteobacteria bacterium MarineAlpha11_Bin1]|nr:MAG: Glutamyl-tRNA(Gln) amidotransferase subunit A [Alphaproteobacteria bacterium MarineAlpha11_Bin1]|tara:strand:- start:6441 stop:7937 length:1497 start_codon:yes stop_codon:yes gene_type:complete